MSVGGDFCLGARTGAGVPAGAGDGLSSGAVRINTVRQTIATAIAKSTIPGSLKISFNPVTGGVARKDCAFAGASRRERSGFAR